jgi:uncharacterized protein with PIN domain
VIVYAESSAVLAWLLGEPGSDAAEAALAGAEHVVASSLTELECRRALARGAAAGRLTDTERRAALQLLQDAARQWAVMAMDGPVLERAGRAFPVEPVRTLDAIHLATALAFRDELGEMTLLTHDERIRANAAGLGLTQAE